LSLVHTHSGGKYDDEDTMPVIAFFSALYCHGEDVAGMVAEKLGYSLLTDEKLIEEASKRFGTTGDKLRRTMNGRQSVFNRLTHEKLLNLAYLRSTIAEQIKDGDFVYHGFASHLLAKSLPHVLRVCLVAKFDFRILVASEAKGVSPKEAEKILRKEDEARKKWTLDLFGLGPWDKTLYDILLSMDSTSVKEAVELICDNAARPLLWTTKASRKSTDNFLLACRVYLALAERGHDVEVSCRDGVVTMEINRYVTRLDHFERELKKIASAVAGVNKAETKIGPRYSQPSIYPKLDLPNKILLVDDEEEFVNTLSERLQSRSMDSVIAYDGEEAMAIVETDAPDVMVLDLKMPGIDGLEVLRRVKREHPATEVIILTGHGSEREEKLAEQLGAFAYLNKPVDIDVLANTMREAYSKVSDGTLDDADDPGSSP
jgi:two-component system, OmpR family, response regulator CpxR